MDAHKTNLVVFISDVCNYSCEYCYNKFPRTGIFADLDLFDKFIDDVIKNSSDMIRDLVILGGEPTLHPQFHEFCIKQVSKKIENVIVWTNFTKDIGFYLNLLEGGVKLAISWHGVEDGGKNLSFIKKALKIPDKYIRGGQIVEVDVMLEQDNFENFEFAFNVLHKKFGFYTYIFPVYTTELKIGKLSTTNCRRYIDLCRKLGRYSFPCVNDDGSDALTNPKNGEVTMPTPDYCYRGWMCRAGVDYIYVHVDGNVYRCQSYYQYGLAPLYNIVDTQGKYVPGCHTIQECESPCCRFADYGVERYGGANEQ